jgi:hypothetical protein
MEINEILQAFEIYDGEYKRDAVNQVTAYDLSIKDDRLAGHPHISSAIIYVICNFILNIT